MKDSILPINETVIKYSKELDKVPKVSVIVSSYNHENFISQCIESIVKQKKNFSFEIIIGEDNSLDDTREKCKNLADKYPELITLYLHSRENAIIANGKVTGRFNFLYGLSQARGKYIALCDGDDYWTDPNKLQKQVDFLEANLNYSASSHWVDIIYEGSDRVNHEKFRFSGDIQIDNIIKQRWITVQTGSCVFRTEYIDEHFFNTMLHYRGGSGDSILFAYLCSKGPINSIEEVMSIYRKHDRGRTRLSEKKFSEKETKDLNIKSLQGLILLLEAIDEIFEGEKSKLINKYIRGLKFDIAVTKMGLKNTNLAVRITRKIIGV